MTELPRLVIDSEPVPVIELAAPRRPKIALAAPKPADQIMTPVPGAPGKDGQDGKDGQVRPEDLEIIITETEARIEADLELSTDLVVLFENSIT